MSLLRDPFYGLSTGFGDRNLLPKKEIRAGNVFRSFRDFSYSINVTVFFITVKVI